VPFLCHRSSMKALVVKLRGHGQTFVLGMIDKANVQSDDRESDLRK
jgi:hypothetical protein